jgi:cytochrome P450
MLGPFKFLISGKKWLKTCKDVHGIIDGFIEEFERQKSETVEEKGKGNSVLLRELVKLTDDKLFIRNELMNIFFPARDTAGILTSNILFLLARHPDVWQKLCEEALGVGEQEVTFELLKSLKYVHGVINESMYIITFSLQAYTNTKV